MRCWDLFKNNNTFLNKYLLKTEEVFNKFQKVILNKRKEELFLNGVKLTFDLEDGLYNIYSIDNKYIGIGEVKDKLLKRDVVISE